jgi:hypothetical protein
MRPWRCDKCRCARLVGDEHDSPFGLLAAVQMSQQRIAEAIPELAMQRTT